MRTTLRNFQRRFAVMRAQADAGETVVIEADGEPRYVFALSEPARQRQPLSGLLARATADIDVRRGRSRVDAGHPRYCGHRAWRPCVQSVCGVKGGRQANAGSVKA